MLCFFLLLSLYLFLDMQQKRKKAVVVNKRSRGIKEEKVFVRSFKGNEEIGKKEREKKREENEIASFSVSESSSMSIIISTQEIN